MNHRPAGPLHTPSCYHLCVSSVRYPFLQGGESDVVEDDGGDQETSSNCAEGIAARDAEVESQRDNEVNLALSLDNRKLCPWNSLLGDVPNRTRAFMAVSLLGVRNVLRVASRSLVLEVGNSL